VGVVGLAGGEILVQVVKLFKSVETSSAKASSTTTDFKHELGCFALIDSAREMK